LRSTIREAITGNAFVFIACISKASLARTKSHQNEELTLAIDEVRQRRIDQPLAHPGQARRLRSARPRDRRRPHH